MLGIKTFNVLRLSEAKGMGINMKRNSLKVVCNPYTNKISYFFKNELGEWNVLSGNSPLSRQYYTDTSVRKRAKEILIKIDEIYNRKNRGVDIQFEGTNDNYRFLIEVLRQNFSDRDINCILDTTRIAVLGKKSSGKTTLIEGLEEYQGGRYSKRQEERYLIYADEYNHEQWLEIHGIDLGKDKVEEAYCTVKELAKEGLSAIVYCIPSVSGRIEELEKDLIQRIVEDFNGLKVMIALTMCYKDDEDIRSSIDELEKITNQLKIVPVLAKKYNTNLKDAEGKMISIQPFGLDLVSKYVFEER